MAQPVRNCEICAQVLGEMSMPAYEAMHRHCDDCCADCTQCQENEERGW